MTKDIDLDALQSCPFCGADPLMQEHPPHTHSGPLKAIGIPDHPGSWTIECPTDGCCGMIADTREAVTATWNRRADTGAETDIRDAARYRWLRERTWDRDVMCVVAYPKAAVRLGTDCPSTSRLDAAIDSAISAGRMDDGTQVKETAIPLTTADAKEGGKRERRSI